MAKRGRPRKNPLPEEVEVEESYIPDYLPPSVDADPEIEPKPEAKPKAEPKPEAKPEVKLTTWICQKKCFIDRLYEVGDEKDSAKKPNIHWVKKKELIEKTEGHLRRVTCVTKCIYDGVFYDAGDVLVLEKKEKTPDHFEVNKKSTDSIYIAKVDCLYGGVMYELGDELHIKAGAMKPIHHFELKPEE